MPWLVVYEAAEKKDGSLFFPERLSREFLESVKRTQGVFIYSNQYLNKVIPESERKFRKEWFNYYDALPERRNTFVFIDPAISLKQAADFTGIVVEHRDENNYGYVEYAAGLKIPLPQLVEKIFELNDQFKPQAIGIEKIAFQEALLYMISDEMTRRGTTLPIKGIAYGPTETKHKRVMGLSPRFEWGRIFLKRGLVDLEQQLLNFPRGTHDDIIDALAGIERVAFPMAKEKQHESTPNPANAEAYEQWYRRQLVRRSTRE